MALLKISKGFKMDLYRLVRARKEEQKKRGEDTRSVQVKPFDERYDIRTLGRGLGEIIELGVKTGGIYQDDKYIIPQYQRGLVWSMKNKQNLISSIMSGSPIGEFIFARKEIDSKDTHHVEWTVIDGQQRVDALRGFVSNEFTDRGGRYFKEYSYREMVYLTERFSNFSAVYIQDLTKKEQAEMYISKNIGGVAHTDEELNLAREFLCQK